MLQNNIHALTLMKKIEIKNKKSLPSVGVRALGKEYILKKQKSLPSARVKALGKEYIYFKK